MWRHSYVVSAYIATLPYVTLSCPVMFYHVKYFLRVPVKITVQVLAAGCQLSYRTIYVFLLCKYIRQCYSTFIYGIYMCIYIIYVFCGSYCNVETNERGLRLLKFATFNNLVLTNTLGPHKPFREKNLISF